MVFPLKLFFQRVTPQEILGWVKFGKHFKTFKGQGWDLKSGTESKSGPLLWHACAPCGAEYSPLGQLTKEDISMLHGDEFWGRISRIVCSPSPQLVGWREKCTTLHLPHGSLEKSRWLTRVTEHWVPGRPWAVHLEFFAPVPLAKHFVFLAGITLSPCLALS